MTDIVSALAALDRVGRGVVDAFCVPSLEAMVLGTLVWCILRLDRGYAPWLRHLLWLTVILKPMITLILPWQGPLPLPVATTLIRPATTFSATVEPAGGPATHAYALLAAVWGAAVIIGVTWTLAGMALLFLRTRRAMPVNVPWIQALFSRCLTTAGVKRPVGLVMSDHFASPALVAVGRPLVVMPSWCLVQLSPQELKQVFLHELLHYNRRDHLTLLLVQIARICFFFHPWVWYAGRRLGLEAERACDMAVVNVAQRPHSYAASLLKVAEGTAQARWRGVLELAQSVSTTALRVRDVLAGFDRRRYVVRPRMILVLVGCGLASLLPFFHIPTPRIILEMPVTAFIPSPPPLTGRAYALTPPTLSPLATERRETPLRPTAMQRPERVLPLVASGIPYATPSARHALLESIPAPPAAKRPRDRNMIHPSALGLPSSKSALNRPMATLTRWASGQIEVQSTGRRFSSDGFSRDVSLRAGYFVTRKHELGGVFSVAGANTSLAAMDKGEGVRTRTKNLPRGGRRAQTRRIASLSPEIAPPPSEGTEKDMEDETLMLGGFYRYNIAGFSGTFVPFVGVGAGVEVRSGRNPLLVNGSGGIRAFFSKRAALILQVDYAKDVELSARSHVNTTLGISTIF